MTGKNDILALGPLRTNSIYDEAQFSNFPYVRNLGAYFVYFSVYQSESLLFLFSFSSASWIHGSRTNFRPIQNITKTYFLLDRSLMISWSKSSWNPERVSSVFTFMCVCLSFSKWATGNTFWPRNLIFGLNDSWDFLTLFIGILLFFP